MATRPVLDISGWQSGIDYAAAAKDISGVIIRICGTGYGDAHVIYEDDLFEDHYAGFSAAGSRLGAYFYAGAINEQMVDEEIALCKRMLAGKSFSLPIYYDIEAPYQYSLLSNEQRTKLAIRWLEAMHAAGFQVGIYASLSWAHNMLNMQLIPDYASVWIAQYYSQCEYTGRYDLWQYTSEGRISGYNGNVDLSKPKKGYLSDYDKGTEIPLKTVDQIVDEVLAGSWGVDEERKRRLEEAGYDYDVIQDAVNKRLEGSDQNDQPEPDQGIVAAQRWLQTKQTGIWDKDTNMAAIRQLQHGINQEYGEHIEVDGIIGPETRAAMPNLSYGEEGLTVMALQAGLNRYGYDLVLDGIFGTMTQAAVVGFQVTHDLVVDAIAGVETITAIFKFG